MTDLKSELADKVQEALEADKRTAGLAADISDQNGVITLGGSAPSEETRRAAGEIAKNVPGVTEVINDLHLKDEDEVATPLPAVLAGDEDQSGVSDALP